MIHRLLLIGGLLLSGLMPQAATAQATDVAGVKYEPVIRLNNAALQLNGAGIRYRAVFKVYTAGLYLSGKAATVESVLAAQGPKRLHLVMLRDIDANELGRLLARGMRDNATGDEQARSIFGALRMSEIFSDKKKLVAGENIGLDWIPGVGTVVMVNGAPQGAPIKEPEFFAAMMRVWLGKSPADHQLKDALLGRQVVHASNDARYHP
jgi:hypothetical protein